VDLNEVRVAKRGLEILNFLVGRVNLSILGMSPHDGLITTGRG